MKLLISSTMYVAGKYLEGSNVQTFIKNLACVVRTHIRGVRFLFT